MALKSITDFTNLIKTYFAKARQLATVEPATAGHDYAIGEQLIFNGELYNAKTAITTGDTLTVGTNIELAPKITTQIGSLNEALTNVKANINNNGSKNILCLDLADLTSINSGGTWSGTKFTQSGAEFTVNSNGSITFSGTPTAFARFTIRVKTSKAAKYMLTGLSGCTNVQYAAVHYWLNGTEVDSVILNTNSDSEVDLSSYTFDELRVEIKRASNNTAMSGTAFLMFCLKSDNALDSTWVAPTKTNLQLTQDSVDWDDMSEVGAVNYLKPSTSADKYNTHYVVADDGTITVTTGTGGNAPASAVNGIYSSAKLTKGTYRLSGCPSGGASNKYYISIEDLNVRDYGDGAIFTISSDQTVGVTSARINNTTDSYNGLVFKPMITPVNYNGPYVPHAKTNRELTEDKLEKSTYETFLTQRGKLGGYFNWNTTDTFTRGSIDMNSGYPRLLIGGRGSGNAFAIFLGNNNGEYVKFYDPNNIVKTFSWTISSGVGSFSISFNSVYGTSMNYSIL